MLRIENLTKTYSIGTNKIKAVNNISFSLDAGTFLCIIGKSGSGKTTLLNLIGGLDEATSGNICIANTNITHMPEHKLVEFRRKKIGYVFQFFNLIPELSARDNIFIAQQLSGSRVDTAYYHKMMDILDMKNREHHLPGELSGGEKQRIAIARALISKPKLLLLDEPTGNLDSNSASIVIHMIKTIKDELGQTVIMVTHDKEYAAYADRVITLRDGEIIADCLGGK